MIHIAFPVRMRETSETLTLVEQIRRKGPHDVAGAEIDGVIREAMSKYGQAIESRTEDGRRVWTWCKLSSVND